MEKKYEAIDNIIAIEVYLYIIFTFITKGEAIRNILLFSSFFLWLATIKNRRISWILKEPVSLLFWGNIASILIAVPFSIDPLYSLSSLKMDPLRAIVIFCLVSTMLSDEKSLKRFVTLSFFLLVFTISVGYYSYWAYDLPLMRPMTVIRHAWHSRFAIDLNTLMSFTFVLFLLNKDRKQRVLLLTLIAAGISGVILSSSRGGLAGFVFIALVWMIYFQWNKSLNTKIVVASSALIILIFTAALFLSPVMKNRFFYDKQNILSIGERTPIWGPLLSAAFQKPFLGWGYGSEIFSMDLPFENTPYKIAPVHVKPAFRNPHNPFLRIFFHQGIAGVILYAALLIAAVRAFWRDSLDSQGMKSYILVACSGLLVGTYIVNAMVENSQLRDLALILGIGLAAKNIKNENSHT
ncbi:MAG: O-antigen ligase family protein [Nitrospirae bacterium]|nr:O-antigen ligase family protein [Nitrospirota bacterium]